MENLANRFSDKLGLCAIKLARKETDVQVTINRLRAVERHLPSMPIQKELLRLSHLAFSERQSFSNTHAGDRLPSSASNRKTAVSQELRATPIANLTAERIAQEIGSQGCVLVKGFLSAKESKKLRDTIDRALADKQEYDRLHIGTRWYDPFTDIQDREQRKELNKQRIAMGKYPTSTFIADSPTAFAMWLNVIRQTGLGDVIAQYIGRRPALSLSKTVLRRQPPMQHCGGWHQDGAFLGAHVKTLNAWIALTDCGEAAPGLDVLPRRIELMPTGTVGAHFSWSISDDLVRQTYPGEIIRPKFKAGDLLLFDHFLLHRTASAPDMTEDRYAIESWFFSPDAFPDRYAGFLI